MPRIATAAKAKNVPPVHIRKSMESSEQKIGQDVTRKLKSTGPAREALSPQVVVPVDRVVSKEKLEILQFMEDVLTVIVHESGNPTDTPRPEVWNDGRLFVFIRGQEMPVARKFVEVLARAKRTTRGLRKVTDDNGVDHYEYPQKTALIYPFAVLHDPSPRGKAWLAAILAEA